HAGVAQKHSDSRGYSSHYLIELQGTDLVISLDGAPFFRCPSADVAQKVSSRTRTTFLKGLRNRVGGWFLAGGLPRRVRSARDADLRDCRDRTGVSSRLSSTSGRLRALVDSRTQTALFLPTTRSERRLDARDAASVPFDKLHLPKRCINRDACPVEPGRRLRQRAKKRARRRWVIRQAALIRS